MASAEGDDPKLSPDDGRRPARLVVTQGANPTVRQRELGMRLRELRNGLGLSVEDVGKELLCSATKISRLETGARRASLRDVRDLCRVYQVADQAKVDELMSLARKAREPGWWTQYGDARHARFEPYIGLEQEAVTSTSFSMYYVAPLLQTGDYARAIIKGIARKIDPPTLDQRVDARLRRQLLLEKDPPLRYRALLDEAVLHRQVGGPIVMQAQLEKILKCGAEEKANIQVIPFDVGAHAAADSNFDLLEFGEDSRQGPVVYVEGLVASSYQERRAEIERYREAIDYLRDAALSTRASMNLIAKIRSTHTA